MRVGGRLRQLGTRRLRAFSSAGGSPPVFLPSDIADLALWIDASDASTITLDGSGNVEQWDDKSGNGRNLTQAVVARRPGYVSSVLNGNPVVRGDGVDDEISTANISTSVWYGSGTPQITYIVLLAYRNTGRMSMRLQRTTNNANRIQIDRATTDVGGDITFAADGSTTNVTLAPYPGFNWYIEGFRWTNTNIPTLRRTSSAGTNTYNANAAVTGTPNDNIAANVGYGTIAPASFDVAEHLIYSRELTDTEMGQIETYLLAKWGPI